jgi:predicted metal-dependent phosphoesterase TrpH
MGLDPIFVTDHDTIEGALRIRQDQPRRVVVGQEIATTEGELIGLFLERPIPARLAPEAAVAEIRAQGGLVYLEHPYDPFRQHLSEETIERLAPAIDIVEVFNGRSPQEANRKAADLCTMLEAAPGAGSDAHTLGEIGSVYIEMEDFGGAQDFRDKLSEARIVVGPNRLKLWVQARLRRAASR